MGVNYNTGVLYGIDLGDLDGWDDAPAWMLDADGDFSGDWDPEEFLAKALGWEPVPYPDHAVITAPDRFGQPSRRMDHEHPDYLAYQANRDRMRMTLVAADLGCSLDSYGHSDGDLTLLVKVNASEVSSDIWTAKPLVMDRDLELEQQWTAKLAHYLEVLEIKAERLDRPGWLLVGSVG